MSTKDERRRGDVRKFVQSLAVPSMMVGAIFILGLGIVGMISPVEIPSLMGLTPPITAAPVPWLLLPGLGSSIAFMVVGTLAFLGILRRAG